MSSSGGVITLPSSVANVSRIWAVMPPPSGDTTGATDTANFLSALGTLTTVTAYAAPKTGGGASATYHVGTVHLQAAPSNIADGIVEGTPYYFGGTGGDIGNIGPFVSVVGPGGKNGSCVVMYVGSGDCLRAYNAVNPSSGTFDTLAGWSGKFDGFAIDGTLAGAGARGLHYGDTEGGTLGRDLMIRNFVGGQMLTPTATTGAPTGGGTFAAGTYHWRVTAINAAGQETNSSADISATVAANATQPINWTAIANATGYKIYRNTTGNFLPGAQGSGAPVLVATVGAVTTYSDTGTAGTSATPPQTNITGSVGLLFEDTVSWTENTHGKVDLYNNDNHVVFLNTEPSGVASVEYNDLTFKIYAFPGQYGVTLANGAFFAGGSLKIRGNFAQSNTQMQSACLYISGEFNGNYSYIARSRLDIQVETNLTGTYGPQTIKFGTAQSNQVQAVGVLAFVGTWTPTNWTSANTGLKFSGIVYGDANLQSNNGTAALAIVGSIGYGSAPGYYSGSTMTFQMVSGDIQTGTLTQNTTIGFTATMAGPQRKRIILTQNDTGGYTVTWPKPGSPTVASPAIYWPGGVAPTQSPAAGAVDVYNLETVDGIHWYGQQLAAMS